MKFEDQPGGRNTIHENHTVFDGYDKLDDKDVLQSGDETAVISTLFHKGIYHEGWHVINKECPDWGKDIGKTIEKAIETDMDGWERLFRRKIQEVDDFPTKEEIDEAEPHAYIWVQLPHLTKPSVGILYRTDFVNVNGINWPIQDVKYLKRCIYNI